MSVYRTEERRTTIRTERRSVVEGVVRVRRLTSGPATLERHEPVAVIVDGERVPIRRAPRRPGLLIWIALPVLARLVRSAVRGRGRKDG